MRFLLTKLGKRSGQLGACLALSISGMSAADAPDSRWEELAPLPDPIGFGGMFAGNSNGILFTGGGSHFSDAPPWFEGTKSFSDRIFVLESATGPWRELSKPLPHAIAHAASAPFGDDVIVAGGMNNRGALQSVFRLKMVNGKVQVDPLPDLPHPLAYAAAAVVDSVFYVVGGVSDPASKNPLAEFWALPLQPAAKHPLRWERLPDFPGRPSIVPAAGSDGRMFYVFGGMHYLSAAEDHAPRPLASAHRFDPQTQKWTRLKDLPSARVGAATPTPLLPNGKCLVAGGYAKVFPGLPQDSPGFDQETYLYHPQTDTWSEGPPLPCHRQIDSSSPTSPGPEPMVAAPAVLWRDKAVIISGEVRPGTRSPAVICLPLKATPTQPFHD